MKQIIRAFSLGLLTAAIIVGVTYYLEKPEQVQSSVPSIDVSIQELEDNGYYVYESDLEAKVEQLEQEIEQSQQPPDNETNQETEEASTDEVTLTIEQGMTMPEIIELLDESNLVSDIDTFVTYLDVNDLSRYIQTGEFTLRKDMTVEELANAITRQPTEE